MRQSIDNKELFTMAFWWKGFKIKLKRNLKIDTMNLPNVIKELVKAQQERNSTEFINCFTEDATVHDEAKIHTGKDEIRVWMEQTTKEYNLSMKPLGF